LKEFELWKSKKKKKKKNKKELKKWKSKKKKKKKKELKKWKSKKKKKKKKMSETVFQRAYSDPVIFRDDRVLRTLLKKETRYLPQVS
jgi:hypothetical protein